MDGVLAARGAGRSPAVPDAAPPAPERAPGRLAAAAWTAGAAAAAVGPRLTLLGTALHPDEAGYLLVAQHASPGGPFLYGDLWVDRPPLLIAFFGLAGALGGTTALRLLALVPVVVLVVAAASAGRTLGGARGGRWASAVAAGLIVTPLLGTAEVDGELLAAPLVALSAAIGLRALLPPPGRSADRGRRAPLALAVAGAVGGSALLVKQNFADALVLLGVLVAVLTARAELPRRRGLVLLAALAGGALVPLLGAVVWSLAWGAGPSALWDALFAFRTASLHVIATGHGSAPERRGQALVVVAVSSGLVVVLAVFTVAVLGRLRRAEPVAVAVAAMIAAGLPAIALGGSYWVHYLIELVPGAALASAVLATGSGAVAGAGGPGVRARRPAAGPAPARPPVAGLVAVTTVVVSALVSVLVAVPAGVRPATALRCSRSVLPPAPATSGSAAAGDWLRSVARPGDSVVVLYGDAAVVAQSGLRPAYPYLWSLPVRTLDPHLDHLVAAVSGPGAATWVVVRLPVDSWGLDSRGRLAAALARGYRPAAQVCGRQVLLRRDLTR